MAARRRRWDAYSSNGTRGGSATALSSEGICRQGGVGSLSLGRVIQMIRPDVETIQLFLTSLYLYITSTTMVSRPCINN